MPPTPEPPFDSQSQGISLDELAKAFAQVMGTEPRRSEEVAAEKAHPTTETHAEEATTASVPTSVEAAEQEDACPISPKSILEAMLFVGNRENRPLTPARAAELMRNVNVDEIPELVDALNQRYAANGAPYCIVGEGDGYRMALRREYRATQNAFYGRIRETRLSQAAIDVLALVAYQQHITAEQVGRLRGRPSGHVLAHLVQRGVLRAERREADKRRVTHYATTVRFLQLFGLDSLDDLPRGEDMGLPS